MNARHLPRPYAELDDVFTRHQKAKARIKTLVIVAVVIAFLVLLAVWLYPKVKALQESRAKDRYESVHKIVLDGRGPELKRIMKEAVKP